MIGPGSTAPPAEPIVNPSGLAVLYKWFAALLPAAPGIISIMTFGLPGMCFVKKGIKARA
jgi:hypothetical protein